MIDLNTSPDKLRKSILQEAMQGKLTQRLPEDGNASDLLQSITEEKQCLYKAGKIKKQKQLATITDNEILFKIPDNWQWVRLNDIGVWKSGSTPRRNHPEYYGGNIPWLTIHDLNDNYIINSNERITQSGFNNSSMQINNPGSVLLAMYGSIGKLGLLNIKAVTNQAICACHPYSGIYSKFLFYYLLSQRKGFFSIGSGGVQKNISRTKIVHYAFPLPPLAEQKRIVAKLDKILPKVDSFKQSVDHIQTLRSELPPRLRRSFLQEAMQGKLTQRLPEDGDAADLLQSITEEKQHLYKAGKIKKPKQLAAITDDEIPFKIPDNWQWVRLGNISLISSSSRVHQSDWKNAGIPFYRAREVVKLSQNKPMKNPIYIDEKTYNEKVAKSGKPQPNDILFTGVGTLGTSWIVDNRKFYFKDASVLLLNNLYNMNSSYLNYFFKSSMFNQQIKKNSKGTAVKTLTITNSSNLIIPLPPLNEQKRIVTKLNSLFSKINII